MEHTDGAYRWSIQMEHTDGTYRWNMHMKHAYAFCGSETLKPKLMQFLCH